MHCRISTIVDWFEELAPTSLAEDWDNVGLLIGDLNKSVNRVMLTLTVTSPVVAQAQQNDIDLIIAHHPIIFRPLKHLRLDDPNNDMIAACLLHDIAVFAAHTNYDAALRGTSKVFAAQLGLTSLQPLQQSVASDNEVTTGFGRVGQLPSAMEPEAFLQYVAEQLNVQTVRHCGPVPSTVNTVAVMGGSGGSFLRDALSAQADVYVTGDIDFHDALEAEQQGIWVVDAGHFATEQLIMPFWKEFIEQRCAESGFQITTFVADEADPFVYSSFQDTT